MKLVDAVETVGEPLITPDVKVSPAGKEVPEPTLQEIVPYPVEPTVKVLLIEPPTAAVGSAVLTITGVAFTVITIGVAIDEYVDCVLLMDSVVSTV